MKKILLLVLCMAMLVLPSCKKSEEEVIGECTVSVECKGILENMDSMDPEKAGLIPEDGIILPEMKVEIISGENGLDIVRKTGLTVRASDGYIQGINSIDEGDCGGMSGWIYEINGEAVMVSLKDYVPSDGDKIELSFYVG